ncbi:MAG: arsenate reductase (glutaredoxin) [Pacificibacter sp.]|uniref:arsenate reductase (glutaredoxin) n=1 Tax=Pacificibacter sp. TaxID=1917866 RepID=UPI003219C6B8
MTKIYHNPKCGTSRNTLAILQEAGEEIEVIEYLKTPPTREGLVKMIVDAGETPRSAMRAKQQEAEDLGLRDAAATDEAILDGMMQHPILINRPFVITSKGTALCRPSEKVFAIMENPPASYTKEDGEVVKS